MKCGVGLKMGDQERLLRGAGMPKGIPFEEKTGALHNSEERADEVEEAGQRS